MAALARANADVGADEPTLEAPASADGGVGAGEPTMGVPAGAGADAGAAADPSTTAGGSTAGQASPVAEDHEEAPHGQEEEAREEPTLGSRAAPGAEQDEGSRWSPHTAQGAEQGEGARQSTQA